MIVVVPSRPKLNEVGSVVIVHTAGTVVVGFEGVAGVVGVVGVVGFVVVGFVGVVLVGSVGVVVVGSVGVVVVGSVGVTVVGSVVTGVVGVVVTGVVGVVVTGVVVLGVVPEAKSLTLRFTLGTESSKTRLSTVTSPEPVISIETMSPPPCNLNETWALDDVMPLTVLQVRPRQSNAIVSTLSKVTLSGRVMVLVSRSPSPSRSSVTV